jgi:hypothetical protein
MIFCKNLWFDVGLVLLASPLLLPNLCWQPYYCSCLADVYLGYTVLCSCSVSLHAGDTSVANVCALASFYDVPVIHAVAGVHGIAGVLAVARVPDIAGIPAFADVHAVTGSCVSHVPAAGSIRPSSVPTVSLES